MKRALYIITSLAIGTVAYFGGATAGITEKVAGTTTETIATIQPMEMNKITAVSDCKFRLI